MDPPYRPTLREVGSNRAAALRSTKLADWSTGKSLGDEAYETLINIALDSFFFLVEPFFDLLGRILATCRVA